ncbi:MAG: EamA/RhaT family transporter [Bacteroidia bacterium]|nr:EamA/RhaT family transporter [Bacteroidia bacterium]
MRNLQAIIANYFTAYFMGVLIMGYSPVKTTMIGESWFPYALFLSFLFIVFFNVGAFSIQKIGLIITSICQRLSLIFPVAVGLFLFGESHSFLQSMALIMAIAAVVLINIPEKNSSQDLSALKHFWYLPFLVLFGNGTIELTLFYVEQHNLVTGASLDFVSILFLLSGIWGLLFMLLFRKGFFALRDIAAGIILGIPNFFTIYLLVKALEIGWEGSVLFPVNNVAVLALTTLIGLIYFKEYLNKFNIAGLVFALLAVVLISQ